MELSPVEEDYLKIIYQLESQHERRVRTAEIAESADVAPATVTHMLKKLEKNGLVEYEPYRGVTVTETGQKLVLSVLRKHRLLETFLTDHLGYSWSRVHEEAERLEHHLSDECADRLEAYLGNPETDPHGDPIPDNTLSLDSKEYTRLSEHEPDTAVLVKQVPDHDKDIREFLFERSIEPGSKLLIEAVSPVGIVKVAPHHDTERVSLPTNIARLISVRELPTHSNRYDF